MELSNQELLEDGGGSSKNKHPLLPLSLRSPILTKKSLIAVGRHHCNFNEAKWLRRIFLRFQKNSGLLGFPVGWERECRTDVKKLLAEWNLEWLAGNIKPGKNSERVMRRFWSESLTTLKNHLGALSIRGATIQERLSEDIITRYQVLQGMEEDLIGYVRVIGKWAKAKYIGDPAQRITKEICGVAWEAEWGHLRLIFLDKIVIIKGSSSIPVFVTTYEEILNWVDTISQQTNALLLSECLSLEDPVECPRPERLKRIYFLGTTVIQTVGNEGYKLIKMHEALWLSRLFFITSRDSEFTLGENYFLSVMDESRKLAEKLGCLTTWDQMIDETRKTPMTHLVQIFGLHRHFGIPSLDGSLGFKKVFLKGTAPFVPDPSDMITLRAGCRRIFATRYKKKFQTWPKTDTSALNPASEISRAIKYNRWPNRKTPSYNEMDWGNVTFLQSFPSEQNDSVVPMASDTAIMPELPKLIENLKQKGIIGTKEETKLLLALSKSPHESMTEYMEKAEKGWEKGRVTVMGLNSKERELKFESRKFGKMTKNDRMTQVGREARAKKLSPLFPELIATQSYGELEHRKIATSRKGVDEGVTVFIVLDFSSWCNQWRRTTTHEVFKVMDEILGSGLMMQSIHRQFESTVMIDTDMVDDFDLEGIMNEIREQREKGVESPIISRPGCFFGLRGGIEGLAQYPWSVVTLIHIMLTMEKYNHPWGMSELGDNVGLKIFFRNKGSSTAGEGSSFKKRVEEESEKILLDLKDTFTRINHDLKLDETAISSRVSVITKDVRVDGVVMPMSLKIFSGSSFRVSHKFPTLEELVGSLYSAGSSACYYSSSPDIIYCCSVFLSLRGCFILFRNPPVNSDMQWPFAESKTRLFLKGMSEEHKQELSKPFASPSSWKEQINTFCLLHQAFSFCASEFGGLPIPSLLSFLRRGTSDPISEGLALVKKVLRLPIQDDLKRRIKAIMNLPLSDEPDYEMMIQSPLSLNIVKPPNQANLLRKMTHSNLIATGVVINPTLKEMLILSDQSGEELISWLMSVKPVFPRALHVLYEVSPRRIALQFSARFERSTTMSEMSFHAVQEDIGTLISWNEQKHYKYLAWRFLRSPLDKVWRCSTSEAQRLRELSWRVKDMVGSTSSAIIEAFSLEFPTPIGECSACKSGSTDFLLCMIDPSLRTSDDLRWKKGDKVPYIGSGTRDKSFTGKGFNVAKGDSMTRNKIKALSLIGVVVDSNCKLAADIEKLVKLTGEIETHQFMNRGIRASDSAKHRLNDGVSDRSFYLNMSINPFTKMSVSTNTASSMQRNGETVTMAWQQGLLMSEILSYLEIRSRMECSSRTSHYHLTCSECIRVEDEVPLESVRGFRVGEKKTLSQGNNLRTSSVKVRKRTTTLMDDTENIYTSVVEPQSLSRKEVSVMSGYEGGVISSVFRKAAEMDMLSTKGGTPYNFIINSIPEYVLVGVAEFLMNESFLRMTKVFNTREEIITEVFNRTLQSIPGKMFDIALAVGKLFTHRGSLATLIDHGWCPYVPNSIPFTNEEVGKACTVSVLHVLETLKLRPECDLRSQLKGRIVVESLEFSSLFEMKLFLSRCLLRLMIGGETSPKDHQEFTLAIHDLETAWRDSIDLDIEERSIWRNIEIGYDGLGKFIKRLLHESGVATVGYPPDLLWKLLSSVDMERERAPAKPRFLNGVQDAGIEISMVGELTSSDLSSSVRPESLQELDLGSNVSSIFTDLMKPMQCLTTAPYKWMQIFQHVKLFAYAGESTSINCLADGSGGVSRLAWEFTGRVVNFNTLLSGGMWAEDAISDIFPPALIDVRRVISLESLNIMRMIGSDITNLTVQTAWIARAKKDGPSVTTCDAEGFSKDSDAELEKVVKIATFMVQLSSDHPESICIMKTYVNPSKNLCILISLFLRSFYSVQILRSQMSRSGNGEIFLVAKGKRITRMMGYIRGDSLRMKVADSMRVDHKTAATVKLGMKLTRLLGDERTIQQSLSSLQLYFSLLGATYQLGDPSRLLKLKDFMVNRSMREHSSRHFVSDESWNDEWKTLLSSQVMIRLISTWFMVKNWKKGALEIGNILSSREFPNSFCTFKTISGKVISWPLGRKSVSVPEELKSLCQVWNISSEMIKVSNFREMGKMLSILQWDLKREKVEDGLIRMPRPEKGEILAWVKMHRAPMTI